MSQFDWGTLVPETTSGSQLADRLNQFKGAQLSSHSGSGRPSYATPGMVWLDTASEPWKLKLFDGSDDIVVMQFDPVGNVPIIGLGGDVDVASAATVNLAQQKSNLVRITGTTTITSFGAAPAGTLRFLQFTGVLTLTHGAAIDLPGGSLVTGVGDRAVMLAVSGGWRCVSYTRANGSTPVNRDASVAEFRAKAPGKLLTADTVFGAAAFVALSPTSTIAVDMALGINFYVSLTGSHVLGLASNVTQGQTGRIRVYNPGGRSLAFASGYYFSNGIAPSISSYAGYWYIDYFVDNASLIHLMASHL